MKSREVKPHPTGRFPTVKEELSWRTNFFSRTDTFKHIREDLKLLGFKGKRNLSWNLLAFYYGVHFYNEVSQQGLYPSGDRPPIVLVNEPESTHPVYCSDYLIKINPGVTRSEELNLPFFSYTECLEYSLPSYLSQIIDGLEEASHLHLEKIWKEHGRNSNSTTNYHSHSLLIAIGESDPHSYRAKLWYEFAALTIQKAYLNYYAIDEF